MTSSANTRASAPEATLTLEELALLADGMVESLSDDAVRRLAEVIRSDPRFAADLAALEKLAGEAGAPPDESGGRLSAAVAADRALGRLLAAEGWTHPAEILDPDGCAGVPYASLIALATARQETAEYPSRLEEVRRRLEEALAAETAEDRLLERFLAGLRQLPPERAARVLSRAVPQYRRWQDGRAADAASPPDQGPGDSYSVTGPNRRGPATDEENPPSPLQSPPALPPPPPQ